MQNFDDEKTYFLLVAVSKEFGIFPSASLESEDYFRSLLLDFKDSTNEEDVINWLKQTLPEEFVALKARPQWIQSPEWPVVNGKPMIFVGQWDLVASECKGLFHDDTSMYLFIGPKTSPVVITQQY